MCFSARIVEKDNTSVKAEISVARVKDGVVTCKGNCRITS
jgi:hypothetical protein